MLILIIACEKTNDLPKYTPPAGHTISKDGFLHKSGLDQPLTNCVSCHGSDLKGETTGVSAMNAIVKNGNWSNFEWIQGTDTAKNCGAKLTAL